MFRGIVLLLVVFVWSAWGVEVEVTFDRGEDIGQNFGSLFEIPSADGEFTLSAGFLGVYNTYFRTDRHTVHFYLRPASGARMELIEQLPRPSDWTGNYLFDLDRTVFAAYPSAIGWDGESWKADAHSENYRMRVGQDIVTFDSGIVKVDGRAVSTHPEVGSYSSFYYAHGHLIFYHTYWADDTGYRLHSSDDAGFTKLYACPWMPSDGDVNLSNAITMTTPIVGEKPFASGQFEGEVLTCSNIGGMYAFDGTNWKTILDGELGTSYQVYSMLNYKDRLLLGQYPTGELFSYDGESVTHLVGSPPVMEGVSSSARELQTLTIYAGELYAGVWPWGELWKLNPDTEEWVFVRRMFEQPAITNATVHPYERECAELGGVANLWGQRVTSLLPNGDSMFVSTSTKAPMEWKGEFPFVADGKWKEYGTVTRYRVPGHASANIGWRDGETTLRFVLSKDSITIFEGDNAIVVSSLDPATASAASAAWDSEQIRWGAGLYGPYGGRAVNGHIR